MFRDLSNIFSPGIVFLAGGIALLGLLFVRFQIAGGSEAALDQSFSQAAETKDFGGLGIASGKTSVSGSDSDKLPKGDVFNLDSRRRSVVQLAQAGNGRYELERFVQDWARVDGAAATAFALEDESIDYLESDAFALALAEWIAVDEEAAAIYIEGREGGPVRQKAFKTYASILAQNDPQWAISWADTIVRFEDKKLAYRSVSSALTAESPELAASWLATLEVSTPAQEAARRIGSEWAKRSPEAAIDWALGVAERPLRGQALRGALEQWSGQDAYEAANWMAQADASLVNDSLVSSFIRGAYKKDPDIALALTDSLRSPSKKKKLRRLIMGSL